MADEMVEGAPAPQDANPHAAFRLRLGSGTIDVPSGHIVAMVGENGSGAEQLLRGVVEHIVRDEQGFRAARRTARGARAARTASSADTASNAGTASSAGTAEAADGVPPTAAVSATGVRASGALLGSTRVAVITRRSGISPAFDVSENVFLGDMARRMLGPIPVGIDWAAMRARTAVLLGRLGSRLAPTAPSRELGEFDRLLVELARALQRDAGLVVLEEPTALLDAEEAQGVIQALEVLRDAGTGVLVLTQKPREALGYADSVVVARDGEPVARHERSEWQAETSAPVHVEAPATEAVRAEILSAMVDRAEERSGSSDNGVGPHAVAATDGRTRPELLRIEGWSTHDALHPRRLAVDGAGLVVGEGEIVGIAGLARSGSETLLLSVYGRSAGTAASGAVFVRGAEVDTSTVEKAIAAGLFFAATDAPRYRMRFLGGITVPVAPGRMPGFARSGMVDVEEGPADGLGSKILGAVRSASREGDAGARIRGLVQAFATSEREVLLLGEPLQGSTAAERAGLVADMTRAATAGKGVVIVSDDLESLRRLCDRIVVMAEGRVMGSVPAGTPAAEIAPLLAPN